MDDLSLVSIDDLIKEIERRSSCFIMAFDLPDINKQTGETYYIYGKGTHKNACSLSNILNNDVMNNWNKGLQVLQRLIEEENNG